MQTRYTFQSRPPAPLKPRQLSQYMLLAGLMITISSCTGLTQSGASLPESSPGPLRGFQIQILTTTEKVYAEQTVAEAQQWWDQRKEADRVVLYGAANIPVEIKWLQPYYRVRLGHFRSREEARSLLKEISPRFPAAFIVPDTID